jgi:hypothetical protein
MQRVRLGALPALIVAVLDDTTGAAGSPHTWSRPSRMFGCSKLTAGMFRRQAWTAATNSTGDVTGP